MDIFDIEEKHDNAFKEYLIERLNIPSKELLRAVEINTMVEAIKMKEGNPEIPDIDGDPLEEYLSFLNE